MHVSRTSVPGVGFIHHSVTRDGQHLGVLVERSGRRQIFAYGNTDDHEEIIARLVLDSDEADYVAGILHSVAISDRIGDLERRFVELGTPGESGKSLEPQKNSQPPGISL